jgi:hypothetical protein
MKRSVWFPVIALGLACAVAGCAPVACPTGLGMRDPGRPIRFVTAEAAIVFPADRIVITDGEIAGRRLILQVEYLGGCGDHAFELYAPCDFHDADPPELDLFLSHDRSGDECADPVGQALAFDLGPLKDAYRRVYPEDSRLVLRIHEPGAAEPVREMSLYRM